MQHVPKRSRHFASDNYAGICPEAWSAMADCNAGHVQSYGDDPWTASAANLIRDFFEKQCEVFFVFNGTAANSLSLASTCQSYHSILCHETAHIETHECGAPEFFSNGTKVLLLPGEHGKITPDAIERAVKRRSDIHYPKPRAVSLTQATELGTVYSVAELQAIGEVARRLDLKLHMDGARFANALASLNCAPREITWQAGIDVLCFGGTKNGMAVGDAVVFFNLEMAREFDYRCKQAGQLASKMRYLSAPWVGMLKQNAWRKHAQHANRMARLLEQKIASVPGLQILEPCQANMLFVRFPAGVIESLWSRGWHFYTHARPDEARLVCSWDTQLSDIEAFAADLRAITSPAKKASREIRKK
jgi:threonine aldolase